MIAIESSNSLSSSQTNPSDETAPLGVFLVKSDSSEEKLLFRFPYVIEESLHSSNRLKQSKYALVIPNKRVLSGGTMIADQPVPGTPSGTNPYLPAYTELTSMGLDVNDQEEITKVIGITDSALSNLFGPVKHKLCDRKFELKVENVRFVGHPTLLDNNQCFHVVFALKANASHDIVKCYHELSQNIALTLKSEESRCGFFSKQSKTMIGCHDEISTLLINKNVQGQINNYQCPSPYELILERSELAISLKEIFNQLMDEGVVKIRINNWININFCLPQKVHRKLLATPTAPPITPANIQACLERLRPYHTFLLLVEISSLLSSFPHDVSPSFVRLIRVANPLKNMLELSADADITLTQAFNIVAQLVYWGKATIIFPLCETNVYMLHPSAPTDLDSPLVTEFEKAFNESLLRTLSRFSLGVSLSQLKNPMDSVDQQNKLVQMIVWMLRKRLLFQFHTYVVFVPLRVGSPFIVQRLSFSQSHPTQERPTSASTIDLDDSISVLGSSYQSEMSFGISPISTHFDDAKLQAPYLNSIRGGMLELNKPEQMNHIALKQSSEVLLKEIGLNQEEIRAVLAIPAATNPDDIRLFAKLCPYFDGHHHIEDIMYYENLRRSQILTLIEKFRDVLLVYQFEDTTVDKLQPYNIL